MLHVEDLRIETEILALFNYTHNIEAEAAVVQLLQDLPPTVELIEEKQAVVQGFLTNWKVLADFSYPKLDFQEVRAFLLGVSSKRISLETNRARLAAKLIFSEQERYQSRARYVQAILFLRRLQQLYLLPLDRAAFPLGFQHQLTVLVRFTERFGLVAAVQAIQEDAFSAAHMVQFARQLQAATYEEVTAFWQAFYLFEAYWSLAKGIQQRGFVFPVFQEEGLLLDSFYHPLLPSPVKNTLALNAQENVVVLTGPNMSGKSTLLKAVGLCVYLAHAGLAVPAGQCALPFFHSILIAINLRDSLRDGYSHFMAEILNLKAVVVSAHAAGRTFAVFDELFRGTHVDDALEITRTTVIGLGGFPRSIFLVSTHLLQLEHHLTSGAGIRTYCIECVLQNGVPVFSYRLQSGWSDLKIGRILFEKEDLYTLLGTT